MPRFITPTGRRRRRARYSSSASSATTTPATRRWHGSRCSTCCSGRTIEPHSTNLRKRHYPLALQHPEKIRRALEQSATQGRGAAEGYWILLLELLQWQHEHEVFEERAIEFAVAFEVSPPSWEPPPDTALAAAEAEESTARSAAPENADQLSWQGTLTGSSDSQLCTCIV